MLSYIAPVGVQSEQEIASVLPFLVLGTLTRMGYLEASNAVLESLEQRQLLAIDEDDPPERQQARLEEVLCELDFPLEETLPVLAPLLRPHGAASPAATSVIPQHPAVRRELRAARWNDPARCSTSPAA